MKKKPDLKDEIETIRKFHPRLIDITAEAEKGGKKARAQVDKVKREQRNTFYRNLLYALVHLQFEEKVAKRIWQNIIRHKVKMGEKLGRNVRVSVAAIDYLQNIDLLGEIKILPIEDYEERTVSSITDPLTEAYTFRYYQDTIGELINRAHDENTYLSLIVFDVDFFKHYNDTHGHQMGDEVLRSVVKIMQKCVRQDDQVIRYGGEEFVIVLYNASDQRAFEIAEKVRQNIAKHRFPYQGQQPNGNLTVSGGVATYPVVANDGIGLLYCADQSMYRAKREGKNKVLICKDPIARDALVALKGREATTPRIPNPL